MAENSRSVGNYLLKGLQRFQKKCEFIGDVRGRGLMIGVELVKETGEPKNPLKRR